ncbi:MAG: hypothetical protein MZU95_14125 [Desulfomicrobium escambiense]|nr:hypothetical protein [Desulfomicrobium escambiense]
MCATCLIVRCGRRQPSAQDTEDRLHRLPEDPHRIRWSGKEAYTQLEHLEATRKRPSSRSAGDKAQDHDQTSIQAKSATMTASAKEDLAEAVRARGQGIQPLRTRTPRMNSGTRR